MRSRSAAALVGVLLVVLSLGLAAAGLLGAGAAAADPGDEPSETTTSGSTAPTSPTTEPTSPTTTPTEQPTSGVEITNAALRWGINNESNNKAYAPDTFNFFSAGKVPDPGRGGQTLAQRDWRRSAGTVTIEKFRNGGWQQATWGGLRTDSSGRPLTSPTEGRFSNHSFVFSGGTGVVDRAAGTATISWKGSVSVLYYSGMSFFYLSDPQLDVAGGRGTVTAQLSGFASSQDNPDVWEPVPAVRVRVADLTGVRLGAKGFTAKPAYAGVKLTGYPQRGPGAFPQPMVDFMDRLGTAAFWYASGAQVDPFKVATELTTSYDASDEVEPPDPDDGDPTEEPIDNTADDPPVDDGAPVPTDAAPGPTPQAQPTPGVDAPPNLLQPVNTERLTPVSAEDTGSVADHRWAWWAGGGLLLAAATLLVAPIRRS